MNAVVKSGNPVPVVIYPDTPTKVLGSLPGGSTVEVEDVITDNTRRWGQIALSASGQQLLQPNSTRLLYGYVMADNFVGGLLPATPTNTKLGLAVIYSETAAFQAAQVGCRFFSIINNADMASRLKDAYPDATIVVRPYIDIHGAMPSVDYVLKHLNGARDPRLIYCGVNEAEQIDQTVSAIPKRAQFDRELAMRIKSISGATYAAGSFSTGAPDITRPDVCTAIQQYYAPYFNSGLFWFDQHLYSPNMAHIYCEDVQTPHWNGQPQTIAEYEWYELRWRFYYRRCGFDPNSPSRIISAETGLDQGSVGGFAEHKATDQDVVNWSRRFLTLSALPIEVGGTLYPSTFVGGAIFQVGDPVHWAGYDMTRYEGALSNQVWLQPQDANRMAARQEPA